MLPPLNAADRSYAETTAEFDEPSTDFIVKWVVHWHETQPVEIENGAFNDLDELVKSCQARFPEMRRKYPSAPPDGFLVFDSAGDEVRRWFESARRGRSRFETAIIEVPTSLLAQADEVIE
jgi:hypothetical protein